ncbi:unnamed protein product (mitochondrion) [Plasmodiophora brassicae]|uniref:Uncharacterized protein n=1 Tax=Plasmodiophora brassicae TaxID=37360 RepID=A0A3P3YEP8_PLABS|nr:unnamed protein product [Plasmodiophora brassicae]
MGRRCDTYCRHHIVNQPATCKRFTTRLRYPFSTIKRSNVFMSTANFPLGTPYGIVWLFGAGWSCAQCTICASASRDDEHLGAAMLSGPSLQPDTPLTLPTDVHRDSHAVRGGRATSVRPSFAGGSIGHLRSRELSFSGADREVSRLNAFGRKTYLDASRYYHDSGSDHSDDAAFDIDDCSPQEWTLAVDLHPASPRLEPSAPASAQTHPTSHPQTNPPPNPTLPVPMVLDNAAMGQSGVTCAHKSSTGRRDLTALSKVVQQSFGQSRDAASVGASGLQTSDRDANGTVANHDAALKDRTHSAPKPVAVHAFQQNRATAQRTVPLRIPKISNDAPIILGRRKSETLSSVETVVSTFSSKDASNGVSCGMLNPSMPPSRHSTEQRGYPSSRAAGLELPKGKSQSDSSRQSHMHRGATPEAQWRGGQAGSISRDALDPSVALRNSDLLPPNPWTVLSGMPRRADSAISAMRQAPRDNRETLVNHILLFFSIDQFYELIRNTKGEFLVFLKDWLVDALQTNNRALSIALLRLLEVLPLTPSAECPEIKKELRAFASQDRVVSALITRLLRNWEVHEKDVALYKSKSGSARSLYLY